MLTLNLYIESYNFRYGQSSEMDKCVGREPLERTGETGAGGGHCSSGGERLETAAGH